MLSCSFAEQQEKRQSGYLDREVAEASLSLKADSDDGDGRKAEASEGAAATDADATPSRSADDAAAAGALEAETADDLDDATLEAEMRELEAQANSVRSKLMQGVQAEAQGTGAETAPQGKVVEAGEDKPDAPNARELGDADAGTLKAASDDGDGRKAEDSEGAAATDADATPSSRSADAAEDALGFGERQPRLRSHQRTHRGGEHSSSFGVRTIYRHIIIPHGGNRRHKMASQLPNGMVRSQRVHRGSNHREPARSAGDTVTTTEDGSPLSTQMPEVNSCRPNDDRDICLTASELERRMAFRKLASDLAREEPESHSRDGMSDHESGETRFCAFEFNMTCDCQRSLSNPSERCTCDCTLPNLHWISTVAGSSQRTPQLLGHGPHTLLR